MEPWTPTLSTISVQNTSTRVIHLLFGPTHLLVIETKIGMIAPFPPCLMLPSLSYSSNHSTTTVHKFLSTMVHSSALPRTPRTWTSFAPSMRLLVTQFTTAMLPKLPKVVKLPAETQGSIMTGVIRDARTKLTLQPSLSPLLHPRLHMQ